MYITNRVRVKPQFVLLVMKTTAIGRSSVSCGCGMPLCATAGIRSITALNEMVQVHEASTGDPGAMLAARDQAIEN